MTPACTPWPQIRVACDADQNVQVSDVRAAVAAEAKGKWSGELPPSYPRDSKLLSSRIGDSVRGSEVLRGEGVRVLTVEL